MTAAEEIRRRDDLRIALCGQMRGHADFYEATTVDLAIRDRIFIRSVLADIAAYREACDKLLGEARP